MKNVLKEFCGLMKFLSITKEKFIDLYYELSILYRNVKHWFLHRTIDRYHVVKTGLKPGYCDKDYLMLHACFNLLKEFVEQECAWMEVILNCNSDYNKIIPWYMSKKRYTKKHARELALLYLDYWNHQSAGDEHGLTQEELDFYRARDEVIKELYLWWVDKRPQRKDWVHFEDMMNQEEEDQDMLLQLIEIRPHLWT